ncbi:MAG TPA: DUF6249 domain-containing protein [Chthoniobacterales bacterium]
MATPAATPAATPSASARDDLQSKIERKVRQHGVHVDVSPDGSERHRVHHDSDGDDMGALIAIPIVGIIFGTIFFAPVMVVAVILLFNFMKQRSLHRTVRMMVEKGQPVPAGLFAPPQIIKARSDMRRGVVLIMVGLGLMIFLGAANDWEGGAWAIGMIPLLIGAGYLTIWKLEGQKPVLTNSSTDNNPPLT